MNGLNGITLTLDGWDLAKKYNKVFTYTREWWAEYKGHWLWIVVGYLLTFALGPVTGRLTK